MDEDNIIETNAARTDQDNTTTDDYVETNNAGSNQDDLIDGRNLGNREANPVLFGSDRLVGKMSDNMARAEADIDETPLRTENTYDDKTDDDNNDDSTDKTYEAEPGE
jgi:hypothetical protein